MEAIPDLYNIMILALIRCQNQEGYVRSIGQRFAALSMDLI